MLAPFSPIGVTLNDARAWIAFGEFTIQPSEFLKLAVVVFSADLLVRRKDDLSDVRRSLKPLLLLAGFAAGTCLVQTDLGSAIVMAAIVLVVAFIGAVPLAPMVGATLMSAAAALAFVVSSQRRIDRFTAFLDITGHRDRLSYQTYQGFLAIADGGLTGSGVGAGNSKLGYLPLAHSDFIFAVIADELGFVGTRRRARRLRPARVVRHPGRPGRPGSLRHAPRRRHRRLVRGAGNRQHGRRRPGCCRSPG